MMAVLKRTAQSLLLLVLLVGLAAPGLRAAESDEEVKLTGDHVANISRMFLRNHLSRLRFDNAHSQEMLERYLARFDSGHYYFLQSDIEEFQEYADSLDDLTRHGNIEPAFRIFRRFKERMEARAADLEELLQAPLELSAEDSMRLERDDAPYPATPKEARELWRKRIQFELLELTLSGESEEDARETLRKRYESTHFRYSHFQHNDIVTAYLNAFTNAYDPHSGYLSADDLENFNIAMRLSLEGIGATLRWEDGYTVISSIIPGGAAAREGTLQPEDKIVAVGQGDEGPMEDVTNFRLIDVVKRIRGERGTTVRLQFLRDMGAYEKRFKVAIERDEIVLKEGEAKGKVLQHETPRSGGTRSLGVIELPSFYVDFNERQSDPQNYKSSSRDVRALLARFKEADVDGLVLDLRNNGGGGLDEAVSLAGLFLPPGPVVMVKDTRGRLSTMRNPHAEPFFEKPMVVLTNRYSASASEIVAGALQDYGRAVVVGEASTFGKGTVQNVINLPEGLGALKTTVAKFYRPGGGSTQHRGVESDIVLPSMNNHVEVGESALDNALPWTTVQKASYRTWREMDSMLPVLRERSRQRMSSSEHFSEVQADVESYLQNRKGKNEVSVAQLRQRAEQNGGEGVELEENGTPPPEPMHRGTEDADNGPDPGEDPVLAEAMNVLSDYMALLADNEGQVARSARG